jgi:hypothetical protein
MSDGDPKRPASATTTPVVLTRAPIGSVRTALRERVSADGAGVVVGAAVGGGVGVGTGDPVGAAVGAGIGVGDAVGGGVGVGGGTGVTRSSSPARVAWIR